MSKSERRLHLEQTLKQYNKEQGGSIAGFASDKVDSDKIAFGIPELDQFIGGGMKRGTFSTIFGGESVGKSTLALQAIANAQKEDKICCYIDLEHSYESKRAISLGVNTSELVMAEKCKDAEQALELIRLLCREKAVDFIVVDSIQALSVKSEQQSKEGKLRSLESKEIAELARLLSKFFRIVAPDVFNAQVAVLMIGQVRITGIGTFFTHATMSGGKALEHWNSTRLFMRTGQGADAPMEKAYEVIETPDGPVKKRKDKKIGSDIVFKLEKTKTADAQSQGSELHLPFYFSSGFKTPSLMETNPHLKDKSTEEANEMIKESVKNNSDVEKEYDDSKEIIVTPKKGKRGRPKGNK